jgi:hypothetical protein
MSEIDRLIGAVGYHLGSAVPDANVGKIGDPGAAWRFGCEVCDVDGVAVNSHLIIGGFGGRVEYVYLS